MSPKKAILITGCDSGFGYSLACHLSENHPEIIALPCCYQMDSKGAQSLRSKTKYVLHLDVMNEESVLSVKEQIKKILNDENGELWTLVNNAATLVFADAIWQTR